MRTTTMQRQRFLFLGLGLLTLWRWALLPTVELAPEEAFAALRAQHGWWGALEGGVLLPLLVKAGTAVFGVNEFGVRFFAPLLALGASLAVWRFARGLFDPMVAGWAVVVLNVLPAFNVAALTLTPGTLLFFFTAMALLSLRWALLHAHPLHWGWWAAGVCVAGTALAAPPGLSLIAGITCGLAWPRRLRHHLRFPGFWIITAFWSAAVTVWVLAQARNGWPVLESSAWQPFWAFAPNLLRWIVLGSPLLLMVLIVLSLRLLPQLVMVGMRALPLAALIPMALLDLLYGPWCQWPDTGGAAWLVPAAIVLAHQAAVFGALPSEQKISLRTTAIVLAGLQSVLILRSDLPRTLGLNWSFAPRMTSHTSWARFFSADPNAAHFGWRESARLLDAALEKAAESQKGRESFAIAENSRIAAALEFYQKAGSRAFQPSAAFPRVHALQDGSWSHSHAFLPRYDALSDGRSDFRGRDALYITDDPAAVEPPPAVARHFAAVELLSVARIMHADNEVRWLKIFSCHDYRPPDL